jgi:hypothetical protein
MKLPNWKVVLAWLAVLTAWAPAQINGQINGGSGGVTQLTAGTGITLLPSNGLGTVQITSSSSAVAFSGITTGTNTNTPPFIFNPAIATGTITNTFELENSTAASLGNQANSPASTMCGNGWGTTGSTSQAVCFQTYVLPSQSTVPFAYLTTQFSVNGGAYTNAMSVQSNGVITGSSFSLGESAVAVPTGLYLTGGNAPAINANNVEVIGFTSTSAAVRVPFSSAGTTFAFASGTGACATTSTLVGGVQAGNITCTGTTGASTLTLTLAATTTAYSCITRDVTTGADTGAQTGAISTTSVTFTYTAVAANDVIQFHCLGY